MTDDTSHDHDIGEGGLWVRSELLANGTYGIGLNVGPDRAWQMGRDQAVRYVVTCYARATEAEHDAAVFNLMTTQVGMSRDTAAQFLGQEIRPDRPQDNAATEPLRFVPGVGSNGPFVDMYLDGQQVGQMTPADLRDHAGGVLSVLAAADLDAAVRRALVGVVGLDDNRALQFVDALAGHWPDQGVPRRVPNDR